MTEIIATAVVELARLALWAYGINRGSVVIMHWLNRIAVQAPEHQILDIARTSGVDLLALADRQRTA